MKPVWEHSGCEHWKEESFWIATGKWPHPQSLRFANCRRQARASNAISMTNKIRNTRAGSTNWWRLDRPLAALVLKPRCETRLGSFVLRNFRAGRIHEIWLPGRCWRTGWRPSAAYICRRRDCWIVGTGTDRPFWSSGSIEPRTEDDGRSYPR